MNDITQINPDKLFVYKTESEILECLKKYDGSGAVPRLPLSILDKYKITLEQAAHQSYKILQRNRYNKIELKKTHRDNLSESSCAEAIVIVAVDCIALVFDVMGFLDHDVVDEVAHKIVDRLSEDQIRGLYEYVGAIYDADGALQSAEAIVELVLVLLNLVGGLSSVISIIEDCMTFWDWVEYGVIVTLQLAALISTGGASEIAEVALLAASLVVIAEDAADAIEACRAAKECANK